MILSLLKMYVRCWLYCDESSTPPPSPPFYIEALLVWIGGVDSQEGGAEAVIVSLLTSKSH